MSKSEKALIYAVEKKYKFDRNNYVIHNKHKISLGLSTKGYPRFKIRAPNLGHVGIEVHRLKAFYLYGNRIFEEGVQVRHLNNNPLDFSDENIGIGTATENMSDMPKEARVRRSQTAVLKRRKFSDNEVILLRRIVRCLGNMTRIAKNYKIRKSTLSYIINKKTYALAKDSDLPKKGIIRRI